MKRHILALYILATGSLIAIAAPIDDAKKLYLDGKYESAITHLLPLQKKSPKDGNVNYYLGASYAALNRNGEAISPLKVAESRGVADASRLLADIAFNEYRVEDAADHLDTWATLLRKNKRQTPATYDAMQEKVVMMRNMLERVERIAVVDSLTVDANDFFTHYKLAPGAGKILSPTELPIDNATVIYLPENSSEIIWAEPDDNDVSHLMHSAILDNGTTENAEPLDDNLGLGGNANYPFMMADGLTLYYASDGEGSLGGYDIFLSRRNDNGFLQPQNIGMPYNSPYDDYMLAIDETTGAGWWATDRNQIPGKVTIYIFEPSEKRINCDTDAPDLIARARITSIAATQDADATYDLTERIAAIQSNASATTSKSDHAFSLSMGDGRTVYHRLSDFKNSEAREYMQQLLDTYEEITGIENRLVKLRSSYANGSRSVGDEIVTLESRLSTARQRERQLTNTVVRLETK